MNQCFLLSVCFVYLSLSVSNVDAQKPFVYEPPGEVKQLEIDLFDLPDVQFERVMNQGEWPAFLLKIRQPLDHQDKTKGYFYQRVLLVHRGFGNKVVINTNGYGLEANAGELSNILNANFVSVEHRFFGPSTPKEKDWKYLTIEQAAADYHHIRKLLGQIYKSHWISTGISKGGETATYYRFFYPDDVALSVPYVAPFPIGLKDQRFYPFFETVGTKECRDKIEAFQQAVLENKAAILPRLKYYLKGKGSQVELIGGVEAALELFVLEYPFSFWQSGKDCNMIPSSDATPEELLNYLIDGGDYWYLLDESTEKLAAHYYQHATQLGYYGYQTDRFGDLIKKWNGEPSACFFPYEKDLEFDPSIRNDVIDWLQTDAEGLVFIYGGVDTWTVAQAELGQNQKVYKYILPGKHHGNARIRFAEPDMKRNIIDRIQRSVAEH
ncbi:MAG: hypothetical protein MK106_14805 [Mariniblastus sp.]|nr:hypothetical protein [Mariniblastus sp.]